MVLSEMANRGLSAAKLCRDLKISNGNFSRWINQYVNPKNANGKPSPLSGESIIEICYYLNLLK